MKTAEEWKPVKDYEGIYEVSNYGQVRSLVRKARTKLGSYRSVRGGILSIQITTGDYLGVNLSTKGSKKMRLIHQLVWDAFGNKPRDGRILQIDHIDENKSNNYLDNLQLLSQRENSSKGKLKCGKSSQYTGVHKAQDGSGWKAQIEINGKRKHLGIYKTEELACSAYQSALIELKQKIEEL